MQQWLSSSPATLPMPSDGLEWVLGILALVIVPAVTEECFFRGGVQRSLMADGWGMTGVFLTAAAVLWLLAAFLRKRAEKRAEK